MQHHSSFIFFRRIIRKTAQSSIIFLVLSFNIYSDTSSNEVKIIINTSEERKPISPYIYGSNFWSKDDGFPDENMGVRRLGGNRSTGYNWENNSSNAGSDWKHQSDGWLGDMGDNDSTAATLNLFHNQSISRSAASFITLQACGYVAKDKNGSVSDDEIAPSNRWAKVIFEKEGQLSLEPDKTDSVVYTNEMINYLISRYGKSNTPTGVKGYIIDNEPSLWSHTHSKMHPEKVTCEEILSKTISLAKLVKKMDENALVIGPALYGTYAYITFQDAPDWKLHKSKYKLFVRYYLDQMKLASEKEGKRLLDVLDIHWYSAVKGKANDGKMTGIQSSDNNDPDVAEKRMQAPRALWDHEFKSDGWIALIPDMLNHIKNYYPDTKLGFGEFSYGGQEHISGGIATADALGIFGKYGLFFATYWCNSGVHVRNAYKIFRDYDKNKSTFGNTSVSAQISDKINSSVYASIDTTKNNSLHVVLINKSSAIKKASFNISSNVKYKNASIWGFDEKSDTIKVFKPVTNIKNGIFNYEAPPLSVLHFVITP